MLSVAMLGAAPIEPTSAHTAMHAERHSASGAGPVQTYSAANGFFCRYFDEFFCD